MFHNVRVLILTFDCFASTVNGVNLETADAQEIGITYEMMQVRNCLIYSLIVTVMSTNISGAPNDGFLLNTSKTF